MQIKKLFLFKVFVSVCISIIFGLICFKNYYRTISEGYIEKSREEALFHSYKNSELVKSKIESIVNKLNYISIGYLDQFEQIDEDIKMDFEEKFDDETNRYEIYAIDEFKQLVKYNSQVIYELYGGNTVRYNYNEEKNMVDSIEIYIPIVNNDKVTGTISNIFRDKEFFKFFEINEDGYKFTTYVFDDSGTIIFGDDYSGYGNIFTILNKSNILKDTVVSIKEKMNKREVFDLEYNYNNEDYHSFFIPVNNKFYVADIMPKEYLYRNINEASRFMNKTLFQVISIIILQLLYFFWITLNQNKKIIKFEIEKNQEIDTLINSVPGGVIKLSYSNDNVSKLIFANDGFYDLVGYEKEEFLEKFGENNQLGHIFEQDREPILDLLKKQIDEGHKEKVNIEYRAVKKNGDICWLSLTGGKVEISDLGVVYECIITDTTEYRRILNDLEAKKEQYSIISQISDEIIFEYDIKTDFIEISDKYITIADFDLPREGFLKNLLHEDIIHKDDLKNFLNNIKVIRSGEHKGIKDGKHVFGEEIRIKNRYGEFNWIFYQGVIINDMEGNIYKAVGKISNIDKFKNEIEELKDKSKRDPLTKVYNKAAIENIVNACIENKGNLNHALFIIDIDDFKSVNDNFGHIFGDFVLQEVASNIINTFNEGENIARIGGDEFVVFLENVFDYSYIEERAEMLCETFRRSYEKDGKDYKISASIGIAMYPEHGDEYSKLLEKADIAVYSSKKEGKDKYIIYNNSMSNISDLDIQKRDREEYEIRNDRRRDVYENALMNVSEMLLEVKDTRTTIELILSTLCKEYGVDRAYIFEVSEEDDTVCNTYEWCNKSVESYINKKQNIFFDKEEYINIYNEESFLYYEESTEILKNETLVKYLYEKDKVKSLFCCYFMDQGKIKGYIGLESYDKEYSWKREEVEAALVVCRLLGGQILKDRMERKFDTENQINNAILDNQKLYTYIVSADDFKILYFNEKFKEIYPNAKIGEYCYNFIGYDKICDFFPMNKAISDLQNSTIKYYCEVTDSWIGATSTKIKWINNKDVYLVCCKDISEYIEQIDYIDSLTGISSISKFKLQTTPIINNPRNSKNINYAMFYMDIDKFKYINDSLGYARGDKILKSLAMSINETIEEEEFFCRLSDDRFLIFLKYKDDDDIQRRINIIDEEVKKIQRTSFKDMKLTIICGIYKVQELDNDLNTIIDRANIARKSIKGSHQNTFSIYNKEMNKNFMKEKIFESRMGYALKNNEFVPYLQPKFDLFTKEICGAEALIRWKTKNGKIIYPGDFINIFEKNGFIVDLDFFIYEEIFKLIKRWIKEDKKVIPISLNVSIANINNFGFADKIFSLVKKYEIPIKFINLELTESMFSEDINNLKGVINKLRNYGFILSIDDFGAAYSSLNLLKELSVDIIKLDKGFLQNKNFLSDKNFSKKEKVIIEYVVKMIKVIGLKVVCEGIETEEQLEFLKEIGCEMGQGYLFSKPISIEEFENKYINKIFL